MSRNASRAVACGETVATSVVITFAKVVWSASRPSARTRQTASRSVKMPTQMAPLFGHQHGAHVAFPHALAGLPDRCLRRQGEQHLLADQVGSLACST